MNNAQTGKYAEFLARCYMRLHGYRIVCRNYVSGRGSTAGEIDFIAARKHVLVFAEVKKRSSLDVAAYAISPQQRRRICNGAANFLKHHPQYQGYDIRFDAILICQPWSIRHIPNAWTV